MCHNWGCTWIFGHCLIPLLKVRSGKTRNEFEWKHKKIHLYLELLLIPPLSFLRCLFPANKTCFSVSADFTRELDCDVIDKRWLDLRSLLLITELLLLILFSLFLTVVVVGVVVLEIFLSVLLKYKNNRIFFEWI